MNAGLSNSPQRAKSYRNSMQQSSLVRDRMQAQKKREWMWYYKHPKTPLNPT